MGEKNSMAARQMTLSRIINAPRELVFEVWTNPDHIKNWWGPEGFTNTISKMDVVPGGEWEFVMHGPDGTDFKNKHIYKEIVKPEKLVLEHVSGPRFLFTATFEAQGDKTLLTIVMLFDTAAQKDNTVKEFKADIGLVQNVDRLEEHLAMLKKPIVFEKEYNAPVAVVWKAITDKDQMKEWYFDLAEFKPEVGFEFQFYGQGREGEKYLHLCQVKEVIPEKKIAYSWRYDDHPGDSLVSFELSAEGDKTKLKLTHTGLENFADNGSSFTKASFTEGWTMLIGTLLKDFVEKK